MKKLNKKKLISFVSVLLVSIGLYYIEQKDDFETKPIINIDAHSISLSEIPEYSGQDYVYVNNNIPSFDSKYYITQSFEVYSPLDELGRCGVAFANVSLETMPDKERTIIGQIKPSGWHTIKYDIVDGKYLYNRCHLIAFMLTGENSNEKNLITGTRYFNTEGMLPFENMVALYVRKTGNHVMYRVTPIFTGDNLVADGVLMEAYSVEDKGKGIECCVLCYNVQPGVEINYSNGESKSVCDTICDGKVTD